MMHKVGEAEDPLTPSSRLECDFCTELSGDDSSTFHRTYLNVLGDRVVERNEHGLAMPTMGQFLDGMMLVLPRRHVDRASQLTTEELCGVLDLVAKLQLRMGSLVLIFEHGSSRAAGSGCGIYHAHIHIVPLTTEVALVEFLSSAKTFPNLASAYADIPTDCEYLLISDGHTVLVRLISEHDQHMFPSQYMRRRLCRALNLDKDWNWRAYIGIPEPELVNTVTKWRSEVD